MSESHGERAGAGRRFRRDKGSRHVAGAAVQRNEILSLSLSEAAAFAQALQFSPFHLCLQSAFYLSSVFLFLLLYF